MRSAYTCKWWEWKGEKEEEQGEENQAEDYDHVGDVGVVFPFSSSLKYAFSLLPFHFNHCSFLGFLSLKAQVISINPICAGLVWLIKIEK